MSGPVTPSPTGSQGPIHHEGEAVTPRDTFTTENEIQGPLGSGSGHATPSPSKEELETNEKNLTQHGNIQKDGNYLGQLVFKLR